MLLVLTRDVFGDETTLGVLTVNGKPFGWTCEDQDRGLDATMTPEHITTVKVKAETAIPTGVYAVRRTWSNRYEKLMMEVQAVPGFRGIRIHPGNTEAHTAGCILPGTHRDVETMSVSHSKSAWAWLDKEVEKVEASGRTVTIDIGRDGAAWARR